MIPVPVHHAQRDDDEVGQAQDDCSQHQRPVGLLGEFGQQRRQRP